jgi:hypothetical protein
MAKPSKKPAPFTLSQLREMAQRSEDTQIDRLLDPENRAKHEAFLFTWHEILLSQQKLHYSISKELKENLALIRAEGGPGMDGQSYAKALNMMKDADPRWSELKQLERFHFEDTHWGVGSLVRSTVASQASADNDSWCEAAKTVLGFLARGNEDAPVFSCSQD